MSETAALALVVLGSVVVLPGALNRFVFPKWALTSAGIALTFRSPRRGAIPRPVGIALGVAAGILAVAALAGDAPVRQLVGVAPRYEGVVAAVVYIGAGIAGARLLGPTRPRSTEAALLRLLGGAAVAVSVLALLEALGWRVLESDVSRPGSLLGNASDQGAWAVLVLGPLLWAALRSPTRVTVGGAVAGAIAVVLSASRGALLGTLAVVAVLAVTFSDRRTRLTLAAIPGGLLALALTASPVRDRLLGSGLAGVTVDGRTSLWRESWSLYLEHPFLGVGPGGFGAAVPRVHGSDWYALAGVDNPPDGPHNWLLQTLLAGGPLLVAVAVVLIGMAARAVRRELGASRTRPDRLAAGLAAGLAGYGTSLLFHFTGPGHTPLAALFGGALLASPPARAAMTTVAERAAGVAAGVVAVIAVLSAVAEVPLRQAVVLLDGGGTSAAEEHFVAARTLRWWDPAVLVLPGHAYTVAGGVTGDPEQLAHGERWLRAAVESGDAPATVLADLGLLREAAGDLAGAASFLDRALHLDPANPDYLLDRGVVAARQEDWRTAESAFLAAAGSAPDSAAPWANLAEVYEVTGRSDEARTADARAARLRE
jgi:O-antigen ligase